MGPTSIYVCRAFLLVTSFLCLSACGGSSSNPILLLPVSNAGDDQTVNEQAMVTLDGSASENVQSYSWSQTAGTAVTLSDSTIAAPSFTAPTTTADEVLSFTLTVVGFDGKTTVTDQVDINITDLLPPTADAGPDQTVDEQTTVTLDASGSTNVGSYSWSQLSGPAVMFNNSTIADPSFTAPTTTSNQVLVFRLTVTGLEGTVVTDDITVNVTNILHVPTNIVVTPLVGGLRINWTIVDEAVSYNVYHGPNPGLSIGGAGTTQITGVTTPYQLMGLTNGINHTIAVTAVDADGNESELSPEVTDAPLVPSANAGPDQTTVEQMLVTLDASESVGAASYLWFQSNGPGVAFGDNTSPQLYFITPVLTADATLEFTLRITTSNGIVLTDTVEVHVTDVLPKPSDLTVIRGDEELKLVWDAVLGAHGYNIYHSPNAGFELDDPGVTKASGIASSHTITGLTNGVVHYVAVTAIDSDDEESPPIRGSGTPSLPIAHAVADDDNDDVDEQTRVVLDGTSSVSAETYSWVQIAGPTATLNNTVGSSLVFFTPAITADASLVFELTITSAQGNTSTDTATVNVTNIVPAPTNVHLEAGDRQLTVTWDPEPEAASYNLYHGPSQGLMIGAAGTSEISNVTSPYVLGGLTNGIAHTVAVTAVNSLGLESVLSTEVTLAAVVPPPESVICSGNLDTSYTISNFAGNGSAGFSGMGGAATSAEIGSLRGLSTDSDGNIYALDNSQGRLYKITAATGVITSIAGGGGSPGNGGAATSALLSDPWGLSLDGDDNIFIGEAGSDTVRQISASSGVITVFAGNGLAGNTGDGGLASAARLNDPRNIRFDLEGNLYIADWDNHVVRKVENTTNVIDTFAGTNPTAGSSGDGGQATSALLDNPFGLAFDINDDLLIGDVNNAVVRKVDTSTSVISTIAGTTGSTGSSGDGGPATSATFNFFITDIMTDSVGNIIIADTFNHAIRLIEAGSGNIKTIAGALNVSGSSGDGGPATSARLDAPYALTCADGKIYIADSNNFKVRVLTPN